MIVRANIETREITGTAEVGSPGIEDDTHIVFHWDGVEPYPLNNYQLGNDFNSVVEKSQAALDTINDNQSLRDLREERDRRLTAADGIVMRHQEEVLRGDTTTLSASELTSLLDYKQTLRDLPATATDPSNPTWPTWPL